MRLETLLPRPLDPCGGSECATLMGALIAAIHLDRRRARALGWRKVSCTEKGAMRSIEAIHADLLETIKEVL